MEEANLILTKKLEGIIKTIKVRKYEKVREFIQFLETQKTLENETLASNQTTQSLAEKVVVYTNSAATEDEPVNSDEPGDQWQNLKGLKGI